MNISQEDPSNTFRSLLNFANLNESIDLKMAYEQYNVPLAGDILDDLAMAFREIFSKVGFWTKMKNSILFHWKFSFPIRNNSFILTIIEF